MAVMRPQTAPKAVYHEIKRRKDARFVSRDGAAVSLCYTWGLKSFYIAEIKKNHFFIKLNSINPSSGAFLKRDCKKYKKNKEIKKISYCLITALQNNTTKIMKKS